MGLPIPAMPTMPSIPSISAGGGGPSSAGTGPTSSMGGFDGSGWSVMFGGANAVGTPSPAPQQVGFMPNAFGLPSVVNSPATVAAVGGTGGLVVSPTLLLCAVGVFLLMKRHA